MTGVQTCALPILVAEDADAAFGGLALFGKGGGSVGSGVDVGEEVEVEGSFDGHGELVEGERREELAGIGVGHGAIVAELY